MSHFTPPYQEAQMQMPMYSSPQNQAQPQGYHQMFQNAPVFAPLCVAPPNFSQPPPSLQQNLGPPTYQIPPPPQPFVYNGFIYPNHSMESDHFRNSQSNDVSHFGAYGVMNRETHPDFEIPYTSDPNDPNVRNVFVSEVHRPSTLQKKPNASLLAFNENDELVPRREGMQPATSDRFHERTTRENQYFNDSGFVSDVTRFSSVENISESDKTIGPGVVTDEAFPKFCSNKKTPKQITLVANGGIVSNSSATFAEKVKTNHIAQHVANQNNTQTKKNYAPLVLKQEHVKKENVEDSGSPSSSTPRPRNVNVSDITSVNATDINIIDNEEYFDAMDSFETPTQETKKIIKKKPNELAFTKVSSSKGRKTPQNPIDENKPIHVKNRFDFLNDN